MKMVLEERKHSLVVEQQIGSLGGSMSAMSASEPLTPIVLPPFKAGGVASAQPGSPGRLQSGKVPVGYDVGQYPQGSLSVLTTGTFSHVPVMSPPLIQVVPLLKENFKVRGLEGHSVEMVDFELSGPSVVTNRLNAPAMAFADAVDDLVAVKEVASVVAEEMVRSIVMDVVDVMVDSTARDVKRKWEPAVVPTASSPQKNDDSAARRESDSSLGIEGLTDMLFGPPAKIPQALSREGSGILKPDQVTRRWHEIHNEGGSVAKVMALNPSSSTTNSNLNPNPNSKPNPNPNLNLNPAIGSDQCELQSRARACP